MSSPLRILISHRPENPKSHGMVLIYIQLWPVPVQVDPKSIRNQFKSVKKYCFFTAIAVSGRSEINPKSVKSIGFHSHRSFRSI